MKRSLFGWLAVGLLLVSAGTASAQERYYLTMFGSGRGPLEPSYTHSFGVFTRAIWRSNPPGCRLESHVISWMPATLRIRVAALLPECGDNLTLDQSMRWALATKQCVAMWGPFEIDPELHCLALRQVARLHSGMVGYKAIDVGYPSTVASNCIHALSSVAPGPRLLVTPFTWGQIASRDILRHYEPWLRCPEVTHDWLLGHLGVDRYPVCRRTLD